MNIRIFHLMIFILLLPAMPGAAQQTSAPIRYGDNPAAGHWIQTRGFRMYYEIYGQGKPVLLIHGNGGSIASMAGQIPYFSKQYEVVAADCRAQGKSVDPGDSLSYKMMVDDLNALLDSLHLDSCYVIGWSDGGIDGLLLAIRHPDKVKKLAVTGANLWPDTNAIRKADFEDMFHSVKMARAQRQTPETKNFIKLQMLMILHPHISDADLQKIHCPTLVIGGDHDIIPPKHTLYIYQHIPKAYLWIVPHSGHGTLVEHRDLFNQIVNDFFMTPYIAMHP